MFTGIISQTVPVVAIEKTPKRLRYAIDLKNRPGLTLGASIAIDGVCQTVSSIDGDKVWFDAIEETLTRTTIKDLFVGKYVNVERAACIGDEIGGHLLSGHVYWNCAPL